MGKHKRKGGTVVGRITEEKAERNRQAYQRYYHSHPEIHNKKRIQMAERRASAKAAKRRWDPPKKAKAAPIVPEDHSDASINSISGGRLLDATGLRALTKTPDRLCEHQEHTSGASGTAGSVRCVSQTSAEHLVMVTLAGMTLGRPADTGAPNDDGDSVLAKAMQLSSLSSSVVSRTQLAQRDNLPTELTKEQTVHLAISNSTATWIQAAQVMVADLNAVPLAGPTPAEASAWGKRHYPEIPPWMETMDYDHWLEIHRWAEKAMPSGDNTWDRAGQLAFAKHEKIVPLSCLQDEYGWVLPLEIDDDARSDTS
ncbi:hypothetical protein DFH09DRAFT_1308392 [Mycena vulgaris]|nr:hypothetical protein DFH09DRAFT_1308392 [Mycena vulgaris]